MLIQIEVRRTEPSDNRVLVGVVNPAPSYVLGAAQKLPHGVLPDGARMVITRSSAHSLYSDFGAAGKRFAWQVRKLALDLEISQGTGSE